MTDAQARDAIRNDLDTTLVVESAAGTGKTTELINRIVNVVERGKVNLRNIVAVTFTEKAAGELKLRLREALERSRLAAADAAVRRRLDDQLATLEEAHVSTIHSFCAELLRERPVEAGVDPLFRVLTEPQAQRLYDEAFDRWLQARLEDPPEGVRRALRRSAFADDDPAERLRSAGRQLVEWRDFSEPWAREPFDRYGEVHRLVGELHELATLTERPSYNQDALFLSTAAVRHLSQEIAFQAGAGSEDLDGWESRLVDLSRERAFRNFKPGRGPDYRKGVLRSRVVAACEAMRHALDGFRAAADADLAALLKDDLAGSIQLYGDLKARAGALDFLDLLLRARDLVQKNREVRDHFQKRFQRIFVDEFQDTDPLQAELLMLLAADDPDEDDWRSVSAVRGKLFIVGDPKQSIYRFRRADVGVYRDVCERLVPKGARKARRLELKRSFRAVPALQRFVNAAFAPLMTGDEAALQAAYVPLEPHRDDRPSQPAVVTLPVPYPYAKRYIAAGAIESSVPDAIGAFVEWLIDQSAWTIGDRRIEARDICVLFRRFTNMFKGDMTRAYGAALDARGIPHVLIGGRSFHAREEIEALRAALTAIEWPEDELSVFATLKGPLFAIGDEELLEWKQLRRSFHPFRIPEEDASAPAGAAPIAEALLLLQRLHRRRNYRPVPDTITELLSETRAHVGLALRMGGEQALANVMQIVELARQYELGGGLSFRGFVDELSVAAENEQASEAPILEDGSDGVRLMTVHKAKGLEFPIVILADPTCRLSASQATRWIDTGRRLCALRLAGWSPSELLRHDAEEGLRDEAEGVRLAYVAATRARDLLVIPAVGDEPYDGGWLQPFYDTIYPPLDRRRDPQPAPGCPVFSSKDSVLNRPDGDQARPTTVAPGLHMFTMPKLDTTFAVAWWDPHLLNLGPEAPLGIRHPELIAKDVEESIVDEGLAAHRAWRTARDAAIAEGLRPSLTIRTVTEIAQAPPADSTQPSLFELAPIEVVNLPRPAGRPGGQRFGTLVHSVLSLVPFDAGIDLVRTLTATQARILAATAVEIDAAVQSVAAVLAHPLLGRARQAELHGRLRRELPILVANADTLIEGTIDLFIDDDEGLVIDFKTDRDLESSEGSRGERDFGQYERQVAFYCEALGRLRASPPRGVLMRI